MATIDEIKQYNEGTIIPNNYNDTYIATKFVQDYSLEIKPDIIESLKENLKEKNLYFDDEFILNEIVTGLIKGNLILQGPPGTGKTAIAKVICEVFNVYFNMETAIPDWTTYDTIGGLQPLLKNGHETIGWKNGRIVKSIIDCCETILIKEKHSKENKQATWLIIDELNRAEIDKVFGDMFTVFGSNDIGHQKKISLEFNEDENKKVVYIPNRYRILGVMNNVDKNYVYDLSQALSRRFSFVTILPPKIENIGNELINLKNAIKNNIPLKFSNFGTNKITNSLIESLLQDEIFVKYEKILIEFIKRVRYDRAENLKQESEEYLGLQIGTAQIKVLYEHILINMIISKYSDSKDKEMKIKYIFDSAISSIIVPQLVGYNYRKCEKFIDYIEKESIYNWMNKTKTALNNIK